MFEPMQMAEKKFTGLFIPKMQSVSFAILVKIAFGTQSGLRPAPVSVFPESIGPYFCQIVLINISLNEIISQAGTGRD
jgi:hypothetical protein